MIIFDIMAVVIILDKIQKRLREYRSGQEIPISQLSYKIKKVWMYLYAIW